MTSVRVYMTDSTGIEDRDEMHHCDGDYDKDTDALSAAAAALMEEAVTRVELVKLAAARNE